jgi:predicted hydrocarbon binding protein
LMGYQSARRLCALAHGFIVGAAKHYREKVAPQQVECMHRGNPRCLFHLRFEPLGRT